MATPPPPAPAARRFATARAIAGLAALALWLGWVAVALYRDLPFDAQTLSAEQILDRLQPLPLELAASAPVLLRIAPRCACNIDIPAVLPDITVHDYRAAANRLPYPWVVLDGDGQLVYAGPALLGTGCGGRPQSAAPLVQRLLAHRQAPMIISPRCSCQKE